MSVANMFLERVENLGLLDEKVLGQLRKQVADAKGPVSAETLAKVLVDNGHLTVFQAKKIVGEVSAAVEAAKAKAAAKTAKPAAPMPPARPKVQDEFMLADDEDGLEVLEEAPAAPQALGPGDLELLDDDGGLEVLGDDEGLELLSDDGGLELLSDDGGLELLDDVPPAQPKPTPAPQKPVTPARPQAPAKAAAPATSVTKPATAPTPAKTAATKPSQPAQPATPKSPPPGKTAPAAPPTTAKKAATAASPVKNTAAQTAPAKAVPTKPAAVDALDGLTPLADDELEVLDGGGGVLDDALLGGADAASPLSAAQPASGALSAAATKKKRHANPWDSALIYVGGGALMLLVFAFVVLYMSLSRGSANDAFQLAEDDFKSQAFAQAIDKYENYLSRYGDDDNNASLARVRIGVAQIRMSLAEARDKAETLAVTKEVLAKIEAEERFADARAELADILPRIAKDLAAEAKLSSGDAEQAAVLVGHADEALELVNNGAYIPPGMRQKMESHVAAIVEEIAAVKREISRDRELKDAVAAMNEATVAGKTTTATELRRAFLKKYPGLDVNEQIVAATLAIAQKEQELVQVSAQMLSPIAPVPSPLVEVTLADRSGEALAGPSSVVALTLRGSVYGVDASSGKVAWRQFVGLESIGQPTPVSAEAGADVLVVDRRTHDLLRLKSADGSIAWRLPVGESFSTPTVAGDKLFVTTDSGTILEVDAASGESPRRAKLPQGATQSAGFDPRREHLYQLGEHSNLFVLSTDSLECREVVFLGHLPGGIAVPPVATGGQVFIANNVGADYSVVHVLSADAEGRNLEKKKDAVRLKGRIVTPPIVDGRRVYVFSDLGAAHVFDVDPANVSQPVSDFTRLVATRKEPLVGYAGVRDGRAWVGDERMTLYELQPARKELARKWSRFEGETFLAPPLRVGETLITARLRRGPGDIAIAAVNPTDGATQWRTSVSVPVRTLAAQGETPIAINANASAFTLGSGASVVDAVSRLEIPGEPPALVTAWQSEGQIVLAPRSGDARWAVVDAATVPPSVTLVAGAGFEAKLSATPIGFEGGILLPLDNGQVTLADVATGQRRLLPLQPRLVTGKPPAWKPPIVVRGAAGTFAIANEAGSLMLATRKDEPQPHLSLLKEGEAGVLRGELAQLDDALVAGIEREGQYLLQPLAIPDLAPGEPLKLSSGIAFGPRTVEGGLLLATDSDGLMLIESGMKTRWTVPLDGAGVAGLVPQGEGLLVVTTRGDLLRVDANGKVVRQFSSQRPLAGDPLVLGQTLWCPGADGAVYGVPLSALEE